MYIYIYNYIYIVKEPPKSRSRTHVGQCHCLLAGSRRVRVATPWLSVDPLLIDDDPLCQGHLHVVDSVPQCLAISLP